MQNELRHLSRDEIAALEKKGCRAEDWNSVTVTESFRPVGMHRVNFSGKVELGGFSGTITLPEGFVVPAGLDRCSLHNVSVGSNCLVRDSRISSADIGDGSVLDCVGMVKGDGSSCFANGLSVHILAEDGARSVPLWRNLSAQIAHFLCHLKNHPAARRLEGYILDDCAAFKRDRCVIGRGCLVRGAGVLDGVWLGDGAVVEGAASLRNCYLEGGPDIPARVGEGVAAEECVFQRASVVRGGVRLQRCLAGEGSLLENGFTGKHSLFFANTTMALGEASCTLAGPFAGSTHKATLMLTNECLFNTFGSGANSSNHHFKLGPRHGGVLRRGAKCGSNSYMFWPSDIGAFSTVVGRHAGHLETGDFPFSLLLGGTKSVLVPAVNIFSAGLYRDRMKWLERDRRDGVLRPLDLVNPIIYSPYTMQAAETALDVMRRSRDMEVDLRRGGAVIPFSRFEPSVKLYRAALFFHMGKVMFKRAAVASGKEFPEPADLLAQLEADRKGEDPSSGKWRDWCGLLLSGYEADQFIADLEKGVLADAEAVRARLERIHADYAEHEWLWLARRWREKIGEPCADTLREFLRQWKKAVEFRHECFMKDAGKEFHPEAKYGFGVESGASVAFRRVRGVLAEHPVALRAAAEKDELLALADFAMAKLPGK